MWNGTASSFVLLNPENSTASEALGVAFNQQVGRVVMDGIGQFRTC
jgi:hypothetical protein